MESEGLKVSNSCNSELVAAIGGLSEGVFPQELLERVLKIKPEMRIHMDSSSARAISLFKPSLPSTINILMYFFGIWNSEPLDLFSSPVLNISLNSSNAFVPTSKGVFRSFVLYFQASPQVVETTTMSKTFLHQDYAIQPRKSERKA